MAYYVHVEAPVVDMPGAAKQKLSAHFSSVDGIVYNSADTFDWLVGHVGFNPEQVRRSFNTTPPRVAEFNRAAITGEHHTHIRPEEVWELVHDQPHRRRMMLVLLSRLRGVSGMTESAVGTFLLYAAIANLAAVSLLACGDKLWARDVGQLVTNLKNFSVPLKAMQQSTVLDLAQMFEFVVLVNRGIGSISWDQERANRTKPDVIKVDAGAVYAAARRVFAMGRRHGYKYRKMKLDEYVNARWEWAPGGSVHSQYPEDREYIVKEYRHRTKFVTLCSMPASRLRAFMASPPQIRAWPSKKYEWAKERAIYGVDLRNTVITNFAMYGCEDVLRHKFPVGEEAEAGRVHQRLTAMLDANESFCYDFDDFNAQHATSSMYAALAAYKDEFVNDMSEEQAAAMDWVRESVLDQAVMCGDTIDYRTTGTLFSGWRLTTFINSVLNYAYMDIAGVFGLAGVVDSVHNGDDVLLAVKDMRSVVTTLDAMTAINARAQASKCNAFSIGEFLRIEHKITTDEGLGAQYLTRACATAVHSRAEAQAPVRLDALVTAVQTRVGELRQRAPAAGVVLDRLNTHLLKRAASVFLTSYDVVKAMTEIHIVAGGTSKARWADVSRVVQANAPASSDVYPEGGATPGMLAPGMYDYTRRLLAVTNGTIPWDVIASAVATGTRSVLAVTRKVDITIHKTLDKKYQFARSLCGHLRGKVRLQGVSKAQFLGVPPIALATPKALNEIMMYTVNVSDPLWCLKVLF
jgi:hypothetical protein